jgi:hypothetical protein
MAGWEQFDLSIHPNLDLGTEIYYAPDPSVSGNYSTDCFGERAFVRRRLALMQKSGLTPAIHVRSTRLAAFAAPVASRTAVDATAVGTPQIMPHRLIQKNATTGKFELEYWGDEGARVDGKFMNSVSVDGSPPSRWNVRDQAMLARR